MKSLVLNPEVAAERLRDPRTSVIIASAIEVHRHLGPGLLESAYEECMCHELHLRGFPFKRQIPLPVHYQGLALDCGHQIDLIVQDEVVLELKSVERIHPVHQAQLLTYMKLAGKPVGLLINFNVPLLTQGMIKESSLVALQPFPEIPGALFHHRDTEPQRRNKKVSL